MTQLIISHINPYLSCATRYTQLDCQSTAEKVSQVVLVRSEDRVAGTRKALGLRQP